MSGDTLGQVVLGSTRKQAEEGTQLRKYLHQVGLYTSLWSNCLNND